MSGNADRGDPAHRQAFEDALAYASDAAAPAGIDIVIEPINTRDMPSYFLNEFRFLFHRRRQLSRFVFDDTE